MRTLPVRVLTVLAVLATPGLTLAGDGSVAVPGEKPITTDERSHWAFLPPQRPAVPPVRKRGWVRNPIDAFVLAALEESGLAPAPEADRPTLLRRLSFDLTGLPPTPAEQDAFLNDRLPCAYERAVERLLASPRYGERWAQHWLDLARYADSDGFEYDQARPDAWRFRDWVVAALNADVPYDRFLRLQLAGDEVAPDDPGALVATGFNRCYPDMVDLNDQGLRRQNALNDVTETTGLAFLGLTIGCARCHDHKFDPIRQADFYRLQAFFTPARFRDDLPIGTRAEREAFESARESWRAEVATVQAAVLKIEAPVRAALTPGPPRIVDDITAAAVAKPEAERSPQEVSLVYEAWQKSRKIAPRGWAFALDPTSYAWRAALLARLDRLQKAQPVLKLQARGVDEAGPVAPPTFLLVRGDYGSKGPRVEPAFPAVLRAEGPEAPTIQPLPRSTGRRAALAGWLTRPDHPLTARVMVNRLWQHHFGRGIVATPSDFGTMGAEPTHPELLDWLATEFVARGWSLKAMHRLMVTGATYRQSSRASRKALAADPENDYLSRYRRTRLDGEAIRDALLAASGTLSPTVGGPPVFPELPAELTRLLTKGDVWPVSRTAEERSRRSLYVFIRRNLRYPFFEAFDRPDTNASCPRRSVTTIAPQALTLLNSRLAADAAEALSRRVERESGPDSDARIRRAFRLTFARDPDPAELLDARAFLDRDPALAHLCLALMNANEFVYID
jgi:hypothetical protein